MTMSSAAPSSIPGTTIGNRIKLLNSGFKRNRARTSPNAHSVPITVATGVAMPATNRLFQKAVTRNSSSARSAYQCNVKPVTGNVPSGDLLKEKKIINAIGR